MRPTRRPVTLQQAAAWRRFQKAMGGDGYFVEYASVGEIADAVVDRHKSPERRLRRVRWTAGLCVKW